MADVRIAGVQTPPTQSYRDVLASMATLQGANAGIQPIPMLVPLLRAGLVVYRREPRGRDYYRTWWQVLESSSAVRKAREDLRLSWGEIVRNRDAWQAILEALRVEPAEADCEDLSMWLTASSRTRQDGHQRRSWPLVQEFRGWTGGLMGWHALALVEVGQGDLILGEVPSSGQLYVFEFPDSAKAAEGKRLAVVDPSWMGGMHRPVEGSFMWGTR